MALNAVENVKGQARVSWPGATVLFLGLVAACGAIPAVGLWLVLGDAKLVGTAVAVGFSIACCSFPILLIQQLRLPLDRLPAHAEPSAAADTGAARLL